MDGNDLRIIRRTFYLMRHPDVCCEMLSWVEDMVFGKYHSLDEVKEDLFLLWEFIEKNIDRKNGDA